MTETKVADALNNIADAIREHTTELRQQHREQAETRLKLQGLVGEMSALTKPAKADPSTFEFEDEA